MLTQWENCLDLVFFLLVAWGQDILIKVESCWLQKVALLRRGQKRRKVGGPSAESVQAAGSSLGPFGGVGEEVQIGRSGAKSLSVSGKRSSGRCLW